MANLMKKIFFPCYLITLIVYTSIFIWGISGTLEADVIAYGFISVFFLLPVTTFVNALILGIKNASLKWLYPVIFSVLSFLFPHFGYEGIYIMAPFVPAIFGLLIGILIFKVRKKQ